ncbi:FAD binding domain-containing protein [Clostridium beijerinckii]|uniref:CO/xanthine dehydrogenase FAD-binding subunit n=1 Tax=Clostridium beijerinckii TaxID=1520 RepID=A0AAE5H7I0_CLOBE|nr:FAD binding domain-containing protein [Clostridium beijerinckii]NSB15469.1 CO/xanthine dehydrogenase FAD-binding subunit [Clostridium beijerinckii]OOM25766.1 nicotinate dehydrogenase FAD-subunit [Clostridium beijerinckii]
MVDCYKPTSLKEALDILAKESVTPYAGGTDLMIKPDENATYLFLDKVAEMKNIVEDKEYIRIGAACTYTDIIENKLIPAVLKEAVSQIAAPAIRNIGTVGGNICNGSPKADSALILFATDSKLRLANNREERVIPISDFYLGRKNTAIEKDELLVEILMNKNNLNNYYYKKVGERNALAISRVSFVGIINIVDDKVSNCRTAFGAVSDVVISRPDIDAMLIGKTVEKAKALKDKYLAAYEKEIVPIRGRVSAKYRKTVCMNLLRDFLESNGI